MSANYQVARKKIKAEEYLPQPFIDVKLDLEDIVVGKKTKPRKQIKSKPAKNEKEEQDKPKVNLFILPSDPTDEEIQEFVDNLLKDDSGTK